MAAQKIAHADSADECVVPDITHLCLLIAGLWPGIQQVMHARQVERMLSRGGSLDKCDFAAQGWQRLGHGEIPVRPLVTPGVSEPSRFRQTPLHRAADERA